MADVVIWAQFLSPVLLVCVVMRPTCIESNGPGDLTASQSDDVQRQGGQG
jgi:hypothetical protein